MKQVIQKFMLVLTLVFSAIITAQAYDITTVAPKNGKFTVSKTTANEGEQIVVTVTPDAAYELGKITVIQFADGGQASSRRRAPMIAPEVTVTQISDKEYGFTMPAADVEVSATFNALPQVDIATATVNLSSTSFVYNGGAQAPSVSSVKVGNQTLVENTDYTVSKLPQGTNVGTYTVVISGIGLYKNTVSTQYAITPRQLTEQMVALSATSFNYNGEVQKPTLTLTDMVGSVNLLKSDYYDITIPESRNKGDYTVIVMAKGNYTGVISKMYSITGGQATDFNITLSSSNFVYDGTAKKPQVTVTHSGRTLTEGNNADYTLMYQNNVNAGTASVVVVGQNNYGGQQEKTFTITTRPMLDSYVSLSSSVFTFNGDVQQPTVTVTDGSSLTSNDYTVVLPQSKDAGTYQVQVTGRGNYSGTITKSFTIGKFDITDATITLSETSNIVYDGKAKTPAVIEVTKGSLAIERSGYDVAYTNNTNAGEATATITAKANGNYSGSATAKFTIAAKPVTEAMITLSAKSFTFNGQTQKPTVTVKDGATTLAATDYTITNEGGKYVGSYTVKIEGKNNYTGTATAEYSIGGKALAESMLTLSATSFTYNGEVQQPTVTLTDGSAISTDNYTVVLPQSKDAGTYQVQVTGRGNYSGTITKSFTIGKFDITDATITLSETSNIVYDGKAKTPAVIEVTKGSLAIERSGYDVAYTNNTNAGEATATITAKANGNYSGSATAKFTIAAKPVTEAMITLSAKTFTFNGQTQKPTVTVKDGATTLDVTSDYTITNEGGKDAGSYTVTVEGNNNYSGTITKNFTIEQFDITDASVTLTETENIVYDGAAKTPAVTEVKKGAQTIGQDSYDIAYSNNIYAGEATVTITAKGNYKGSATAKFIISSKSLSVQMITLSQENLTFNGKTQQPAVTVSDGDKTLAANSDYVVTSEGATSVGNYKVTIEGLGNYSGKAEKQYSIKPKNAATFYVNLNSAYLIYNGTEQKPAVTVMDGDLTLTEGTHYNTAYTDNINVGTATVTVTGIGDYIGTSSKTFTIGAKSLSEDMVSISETQFVYNGKTQMPDVTVTDGSNMKQSDFDIKNNGGINVGTYNVIVNGKGNYTGRIEKSFTISKKQLTDEMVALSEDVFTYNGEIQLPEVTVADDNSLTSEDYTIVMPQSKNNGTYQVKVTGRNNYNGTITKSFTIEKLDITDATVKLSDAENNTYDGTAKRPAVIEVTKDNTIIDRAGYDITYANNINAGEGTVLVTARGNYTGTSTVKFTIAPKPATELNVTLANAQVTYNGEEQRPAVTVMNGNTVLVEEEQYNVEYADNKDVGTATVTVTGKGNFTGSCSKTFFITPKTLKEDMVKLSTWEIVYTGEVQKPEVMVSDEDFITEDDYEIVNDGGTKVGDYNVVISAKGNYQGIVAKTYHITPKQLQRDMITLSADTLIYNGHIQKPVITVSDGTAMDDGDYRIIDEGGYNIGTYEVKVKAMGNYTGEETFNYEIVPLSMETASVTVNELSSYIYDGQEKRPAVREVSIGDMMLPSANYEVSYTDNINAGEATIHISGNGNFSGEATRTFTILPKEITKEMLTLSDTVFVFNGDFQLPEITMMDGEKQLAATEDYDFTYNSRADVGNFTVTIEGKNNYTGTIEGSFRIAPKDISGLKITYAIDTVFIYNGKEHKPEVLVQDEEIGEEEDVDTLIENGDYTLTYSNNVNAGTATITIEGMYCYEGTYSLTFDIQPRELTEDMVSMAEVGLRYDGTVQKPEIAVSDTILITEDDYTIYNPGGIDAGDYTATVTGKRNYQGKVTLDYEIMKALLGMTRITGMTKPETGEQFDTIAYCRTKGIKSISPVKWTPADSIVMPETVYKGSVVITADENHMFNLASSGYIVSVNGEYVLPDSITGEGTIMTVSYTFEPTMAQTEQPMEIAVEGATVTDDRIRFVVTVTDEETKEARIDRLIIEEEASSITKNLFIPAKATMPNGVYTITDIKDGAFLGNTNVTDIYMPESDKAIYMSDDALLLTDETSDETKNIPTPMVRIHTPLSQLADYALMDGLEDHFNEGKIMSTATAKNRYWTFSCGVDVVMPEGVKAYTVNQRDENTVEITELTDNELVIGNSRVIKAGNGILFGGEYMVSENTENDSIGNDSIPEDIIPEDSIGNDSIPEDIIPEDSIGGDSVPNDSISRARMRYAAKMIGKQYDIIAFASRMGSGDDVVADDQKDYGEGNLLEPVVRAKRFEGEGYYVLSNNTFHAISNDGTSTSTVPACKAVLHIEHADGSRILKIATSDATAIKVVKALTGNSNTQWFDINGRRINSPTKKGHYIMHNGENSKHILIK